MIYNGDNILEFKRLFKHTLENHGITMTDAARASGLSPQELNNRFLRKDISPSEIARILSAIGFQLIIDIIPVSDNKTE